MTKRIYLENDNLTTKAKVTAIGHDDHGHWVILDQTTAHAKGGGAKADRGTINTATFTEVVAPDGRDGHVYHYLDAEQVFAVGNVVEVKVDCEWRSLQAAYHSAGHLLAAVAEEQYPSIQALGGHHYPGEARIEFGGEPFPGFSDLKTKLNVALDHAIELDLPIHVVGDPYQNRQVQIGVFKPVPCGGVHCKSTRELGRVEIKSVKVKSGRLRLSYEVLRT